MSVIVANVESTSEVCNSSYDLTVPQRACWTHKDSKTDF